MVVKGHEKSFWFITVISNPMRYKSRVQLYDKFRKHIIDDLNSNLLTVELMLGECDALVTTSRDDNPLFPTTVNTVVSRHTPSDREIHVQVRSDSVLWHKENMLNAAIAHLPGDCKYVAWVDADIEFLNKNIVEDTVHKLQMYKVLQMFQHCIDMGPEGEVMHMHTSFAYCYINRLPAPWEKNAGSSESGGRKRMKMLNAYEFNDRGMGQQKQHDVNNIYWHCGYAYAIRLDTLNALGGFFDQAILGSGDHHMACCFVGHGDYSVHPELCDGYRNAVMAYQELCNRHIAGRFGFVPGTIKHGFHGMKQNRGYLSRWDILKRHNYDPIKFLKRNLHGMYEFAFPEHPIMHDIIAYFKSRNEDSLI